MKYFLLIIAATFFNTTLAESKRIEVYTSGISYWDVQPGDTLGEIVARLLPNNSTTRPALMNEIVKLNPDAFIDANPDFLNANTRLWLPGHNQALGTRPDTNKYIIKEFSWGYIQTLKQ